MRVWRLKEYFWDEVKVDKIFVNVENAIKAGLELAERYKWAGVKDSAKDVTYVKRTDWVDFYNDKGVLIESVVLEAEDTED